MSTIAIGALPHDGAFRALSTIEGIRVDLRYAGPRNLLGRDLYTPHDCAWLHADAAAALQAAVAALAAQTRALQLCVLDAARPQRVQEQFWAHVRGTPMQAYFAPPERGSIHSFGMAVDITLCDADGREVDMGTPFDDTTELSHPALEAVHGAAGRLSASQLDHRRLLRRAMEASGWRAIATEWWHFDCGDRDRVRSCYRRII